MLDKKTTEKLADIEHQRWADWQKYLHSRGIEDKQGEGYLCLPMGLVKHWERQIKTPYSELSESEKESDRKQVRRYLPIIEAELSTQKAKSFEEGAEGERERIIDEILQVCRVHKYLTDEIRDKVIKFIKNHDKEGNQI